MKLLQNTDQLTDFQRVRDFVERLYVCKNFCKKMSVFIENIIKKKICQSSRWTQLQRLPAALFSPTLSGKPRPPKKKESRAPKTTSFWGPVRDNKKKKMQRQLRCRCIFSFPRSDKKNGLLAPGGFPSGRSSVNCRCKSLTRPNSLSPPFSRS